jgi:hypothetical protein
MGHKTLHHNLDGTSFFEDTRTTEEAHQENLTRIREIVTAKITEAGYDEIWQRNASLGVLTNLEVEQGREFIANLRSAYHDYKTRLLTATRDGADSVEFVWQP